MRILLLKDIRDLGRRGDIKDVADGYARNFLVPRDLAQVATAEVVSRVEREKTVATERHKELVVKLQEEARKMKESVWEFKLKTGEKGEVFGSVGASAIEKALAEKGFHGARVILERPIKSLGEYGVEVDLGEGVKSRMRILVSSI